MRPSRAGDTSRIPESQILTDTEVKSYPSLNALNRALITVPDSTSRKGVNPPLEIEPIPYTSPVLTDAPINEKELMHNKVSLERRQN